MGYRRSAIAHAMVTGKTNTLGIMTWSISGYAAAHIISGIVRYADEGDLLTKIFSLNWLLDNQSAIDTALEQRLTGIITIGADLRFARQLKKACTPYEIKTVHVSGDEAINPDSRVFSNDREGIYQLVKHLRDLGHDKITYLAGRGRYPPAKMRKGAFREAIQELNVPDGHITELNFNSFTGTKIEEKYLRKLLERKQLPTAFICESDILAMQLIRAASKAGYALPDDISITGYSNHVLSDCISPVLTTVTQPFEAIGYKAASILLDDPSEDKQSAERNDSILPVELLIRESTSKARVEARDH